MWTLPLAQWNLVFMIIFIFFSIMLLIVAILFAVYPDRWKWWIVVLCLCMVAVTGILLINQSLHRSVYHCKWKCNPKYKRFLWDDGCYKICKTPRPKKRI